MADTITVAGLIATPIKHTVTEEGLAISSFRLASNSRRFDRASQAWVDGDTNWFTVTTFRQLAVNLNVSLDKGHRVVVSGRLRVREWRNGEQLGREVEIVADALGPDLAWGRAEYTRTPRQAAPSDTGAVAHEAPPLSPDSAGADSSDAASDGASDPAGFPAERDAVATPF